MIETSTPTKNSLQNDMVQSSTSVEYLTEGEQSFYASIKRNLNAIVSQPMQETITKILNYSKSV